MRNLLNLSDSELNDAWFKDGFQTLEGPVNYKAGNDYIVRHGPGDYGVVKADIFKQTYAS